MPTIGKEGFQLIMRGVLPNSVLVEVLYFITIVTWVKHDEEDGPGDDV